MTGRLRVETMTYPRRRINDAIRMVVWCPICRREPGHLNPDGTSYRLTVVRWRASAVRLLCPDCGLRFSIDRDSLVEVLRSNEFVTALWQVTIEA